MKEHVAEPFAILVCSPFCLGLSRNSGSVILVPKISLVALVAALGVSDLHGYVDLYYLNTSLRATPNPQHSQCTPSATMQRCASGTGT